MRPDSSAQNNHQPQKNIGGSQKKKLKDLFSIHGSCPKFVLNDLKISFAFQQKILMSIEVSLLEGVFLVLNSSRVEVLESL